MQKIIFSILVMAATLVACNSSDELTTTTASENATVASYVAENYPDASVVSTTSTASSVSATLSTGETITLSKAGRLVSYSNNSASGLAADSLTVNDSTDTKGHHRGGHGKHGKHGHPRNSDNEIAVDSLPDAINNYILTNYSSYTVIHAQTDTLCSGVVTAVMICKKESEPMKLVFDANGTFLMSGVRALSAGFPEAVLTTITTNYADYTLRKRGSIYSLTDGTTQYKVYLKSGSSKLFVFINADGTVVCAK